VRPEMKSETADPLVPELPENCTNPTRCLVHITDVLTSLRERARKYGTATSPTASDLVLVCTTGTRHSIQGIGSM
jgi:hypothetical protein